MDWSNILQYAAIVVAVASVAGVKYQQSTIGVLKESNAALEERGNIQDKKIIGLQQETQSCLASHEINDKKITALEARLATYDDLALVPKDFIEKHDQTQKQIVSILERIESNQPNKVSVARAVKRVKTDLEHSNE